MSNRKQRRAAQAGGITRSVHEPLPDEINYLIMLFNQGQFAHTEICARKIIEQFPGFGFGWKVLGAALKMQGKIEDAVLPMHKAVELLPDDQQALSNLGGTLKELGRYSDAEALYAKAIKRAPGNIEAHFALAVIFNVLGRTKDAEMLFRRVLTLSPGFPAAHYNLGNVLVTLGKLTEARENYVKAVELDPCCAEAYFNLGNLLNDSGSVDDAILQYQQALKIRPTFAEALYNLGIIHRERGQMPEALGLFKQAIEHKPDYFDAYSNVLALMNSVDEYDPIEHLKTAKAYGQLLSERTLHRFTAWNCRTADGKLKVGFVSGDLHNHPVGFFLENILAHLDCSRLELFAYCNHCNNDELTERIKPYFSAWRDISTLDDDSSASLVHTDGIHILIDLSGHTAHNRLPVFTRKPAPLQCSWLGYFATTGVRTIDYLIADKTGVPENSQGDFCEKIWYLPDTRLCFSPPVQYPEISEVPVLCTGAITFGSFQSLQKITDRTLLVWKKVLQAVPGAQLRLQNKQFDDEKVAADFIQRMQKFGINSDDCRIYGAMSRELYLAAYSEIDIILDTLQYTGGTTTCEGLWMGVPTLTLAGNSLIARQGASLMKAAGLHNWVAESEDEFVSKAVMFSSDLEGLSELRNEMRQKIQNSPLFDAKRFAGNFADALTEMWQIYTSENVCC